MPKTTYIRRSRQTYYGNSKFGAGLEGGRIVHTDGLVQGGCSCAVHVPLAHGLKGKGEAHGLVSWLAQHAMLHRHAAIRLLPQLDLCLCVAGACLQDQTPASDGDVVWVGEVRQQHRPLTVSSGGLMLD